MTLFHWLVIAFLIVVNALYVAAEFAAVGVRKSRVQQLAQNGNALARSLLPVIQDGARLDRYIAACQIGITLSSLVLGAYGQATLAKAWTPLFEHWGGLQNLAAQSTAAVVVLVFLTVLQVIMGELVPKSIALQYPTQAALYTVLPMRWSLILLSWFVTVLNGSGIGLLKLLRLPNSGHRHIHSSDEISMLLADSRDGGMLEEEEHQRLHQALQLTHRKAHELMVARRFVTAIDVDTPTDRVLGMVAESPYTRFPVYQGTMENVVGILHTKDLVARYVEEGAALSMRDILRPAVIVPRNVTSDRLLALMRERRTHQAIVVDESGATRGLVTLEDVLTEMLGDVADEFKGEQPQPQCLLDGRVRLPGLMRADKAERWIGTHWEGDADTVGGKVIQALGHFPIAGETVSIAGCKVEVETVGDHIITSLVVTPRSEEVGGG